MLLNIRKSKDSIEKKAFIIKSDFNILIPFLLVKVGRFFGTFTDLSYICSEV